MTASRAVRIAAIVALLVVVDRASSMWHGQVDLTAGQSLTLSQETRRVLRQVHHRIDVTVFLERAEPGRPEAAALLDRYHRANRLVRYRLVDPTEAPGEAERLSVDPGSGGIVLQSGTTIEHAPTPAEQDVTAGIARLVRGVTRGVCFATGHGEATLDDTVAQGLSAAGGALVANGYRIKTIDLLRTGATVDPACDAVVVAGPTAPLGAAGAALASYLASGGRALVLAEAGTSADLGTALAGEGVSVERGLVFEGDPSARLGDDPLTLVVRRFRSASPVVRHLPPIVLAGAQGVTARSDTGAGLTSTVLATTTRLAYLERDPLHPAFDRGRDLPGPVAVAVATDRSRVDAGKVTRTRVVVVGDVSFATNELIGEGGNARFLVQALDWLTLDEDLVTVSANLPSYRPLALTPARLLYARFVAVGVVPGLFLLAGALLWALRRGR